MISTIVKGLLTYIILSLIAGGIAGGFDCSETLVEALVLPPLVLFLSSLVAAFLGMILSA